MEREFYSFTELRMMNSSRLRQVLDTFQSIKVPVNYKQNLFLYFRAFPSSALNGYISMINKVIRPNDRKQRNRLNMNRALPGSKGTRGGKTTNPPTKNVVKTYSNPMTTRPKASEQKQYQNTTQKILKNFPEQRTLMVINFDSLFEPQFLKEIFQIHGKVRRIFNEKIVSTKRNKKRKECFLTIIVFKNRIDMVKLFDVEHFQFQLLKKFYKRFEKMSETDQKETFEKYVAALRDQISLDR